MISTRIEEFKGDLLAALESPKVTGKALLDRFCVIDEMSRRSPSYLDHRYSGFYYELGKMVSPDSIVELGFDLGLLAGALCISCKTPTRFLGFREVRDDYFSVRLGRQNIKRVMKGRRDFYVGGLYDLEFEGLLSGQNFDMGLVTDTPDSDKLLEYLDFVWPHISDNGIIVCENVNKNRHCSEGFLNFCESKNRKGHTFPTRYGTGLVQK